MAVWRLAGSFFVFRLRRLRENFTLGVSWLSRVGEDVWNATHSTSWSAQVLSPTDPVKFVWQLMIALAER